MRRAFAVAYRILGHREDAEDLVWEHAARWSRAAVPALLAASAVIAMLLAAPPLSAPDAGEPASVAEAADATPEQVAIDLALADDVPDGEVVDAFVAASEDAWILQWVTDDE